MEVGPSLPKTRGSESSKEEEHSQPISSAECVFQVHHPSSFKDSPRQVVRYRDLKGRPAVSERTPSHPSHVVRKTAHAHSTSQIITNYEDHVRKER